MAVHAGRLQFGASQSGAGQLEVADDLTPAGLSVQADMNSLAVREGQGGVKPLTDRDRREIVATARKLLGTDRHPEATFVASKFVPDELGGYVELPGADNAPAGPSDQ